ncbi:hypothetical protein [Serratia fonticola]|uniref:hypothetical protein n=1 Tax=Serratia fonticola TaxID=47917 RepID=UPI003BB76DD8
MKNKIDLEITFTEILSFLFTFVFGLLGVLFTPYILKNELLPYLSYPDVVSFYRMANYMVAGFFGFVMMMVMSGYILVTRRKDLTKIKKFSMLCIYLTVLLFVLVTVFNLLAPYIKKVMALVGKKVYIRRRSISKMPVNVKKEEPKCLKDPALFIAVRASW